MISDHHPFGASSDQLAKRIGVEMGKSTTYDPANAETGLPAQLNFTRVNKLLGDHPILSGRDGSERIDRVLTFAGQSLKGPKNAVALLKFSQTAVDQPGPAAPGRTGPASGRAQGIAFTLGKGNVVVLGEAGMLSAQVNRGGGRMGMNVPGTDNRQFALNAMHWLSHIKLSAEPADRGQGGFDKQIRGHRQVFGHARSPHGTRARHSPRPTSPRNPKHRSP